MTNDPLGIGVDLTDTYSGVFQDEAPPKPMLESAGDDNYIFRIDNSTLEKWQTCPRAFYYYAVEGREKPGSPALNFGRACHMGWEVFNRHGIGKAQVQKVRETLTEHFIANPQPADDYRNLEYGIKVMEEYAQKYNISRCSTVEHNGEPLVEFPFSLNIGEVEIKNKLAYSAEKLLGEEACGKCHIGRSTPLYVNKLFFFWSGKIDAIVEFDDRRWVMDHKTASMAGPTFYNDFYLAQQMAGYVWAVRNMFDFDVEGLLLDAAETRRPTKTGKGLQFNRQFYTYDKWICDEFMLDVKSQIGSCVDQLVTGYFPKKTKWCMGKYGACPYHDVCVMQPDRRNAVLHSSNYGNVHWSPLIPGS